MDQFKVPKKVNRHTMKALAVLCGQNLRKPIALAQIIKQVKIQMRHLAPVRNVEEVVQRSLKNLSALGIIQQHGPRKFSVGQNYSPSMKKIRVSSDKCKTVLKPGKNRKSNESVSELDPNRKRRLHDHSDDDLSDNIIERERKRSRFHPKLDKIETPPVKLPKVKQHKKQAKGERKAEKKGKPNDHLEMSSSSGVSGQDVSPDSSTTTSLIQNKSSITEPPQVRAPPKSHAKKCIEFDYGTDSDESDDL